MIKSIALQNWKTHLDSRLEFVKGTNVIVGPMGSGKSSIMDAISFALYGTFPLQAARRVSLEETIMDRPMKQERATVKLEFGYGGKEYSIERMVKRNGLNEAYLREGGRIISGPKPTDVNAKVEEILEVNYDLFSRAVYSEQNQIDYFLRLSPAQRKEKFDELLGLDRYERVRQNAGTLSNRLKKMVEDRKAFLTEQKKKFDPAQLSDYAKRISEKEKELAEKKAGVEFLMKETGKCEATLRKLEEEEREHKTLNELYIKTRARFEALKEQLFRAKEKLKGKDTGKIRAEINALEKKTAEAEAERKELGKALEAEEKKLTEVREQRAALRSVLEVTEKTLKGARGIGGECPVCRRPLAKHDREKLEKELTEEIGKAAKAIEEMEGRAKKISAQAESTQKKIDAAEREMAAAEREIDSLKRALEGQAEIEEKWKGKVRAEAELVNVSRRLAKSPFDAKALTGQRNALMELREKSAKLRAEARSAEELMKELEAGMKKAVEAQEQIAGLERQLAGNTAALEKIAVFTSALRATQAELRYTMIETINEAMDEVWGKVYPYDDLTSVKIDVQEGSYEVVVRQRSGEWIRVEGILSGGERSSVALTMRISVSLVLTQNLGWIILDEPTHNLDANAVRELSEMMRTHLPELIEQMFIITHDKEMENAASGKLYVLEREKGNDGATRIVGE